MKDSPTEARAKGRHDNKGLKSEDGDATHDDQGGEAKPVQRRGRPRKVENPGPHYEDSGGSEENAKGDEQNGEEEKPKGGRPRKKESKAFPHEDGESQEHGEEEKPKGGRPRKKESKAFPHEDGESQEHGEEEKPKRGRPRKNESKESLNDDADEDIDADEDEKPKKTKQMKQVHDTDEPMNGKSSMEEFEEFVQQLHSNVSLEEVKTVLEENGMDILGSEEQLHQRSADLLFFGTCEICPSCGGSLEFSGQTYHCSSWSTEWTKCNYTTPDGRKGGKAKLPTKLKSEFLRKFVKNHTIATRELEPGDKPFSGMTFVLEGRMSCPQGEIRQLIHKHGGTVKNAVRQGVTVLLCPDGEISGGGSSKLVEATEQALPVCRESWLYESIDKMKALPLDVYTLASSLPTGGEAVPWDKRAPEDEAAVALVEEVKLVGKRGVYKDTELQQEGGKIYEKDGIIYNCAFSVCDIYIDLNQYAILQLVEVPKSGGEKKRGRGSNRKVDIYLYVKEGRVGDRRGVRERLDLQDSPQAAAREFGKYFEKLTGNKFLNFEKHKKFSKKRNKYFPIDMAPGVDVRAGALADKQVASAAAHSKVDSRVVEILKHLFRQSTYRYAMTEIGVDAPDLPIGNLTDWHIELCQKYLVEFCDVLKNGKDLTEQKREQVCLDFSNKWFTLLHSTRPFVIHDLNQLAELAAPTLETVRDISHASRLIGDMSMTLGGALADRIADMEDPNPTISEDADGKPDESLDEPISKGLPNMMKNLDDPIADRYAKLGCMMTPLDRDGDDYKMILKYFSKTMDPLKFGEQEFRVVIDDIVQLESKAAPSLEEIQETPNRMLLWCGMRTSNLVAALHREMLPAPIDAPAPYYSFGRGIYFTDAAAKAAQYGFTAVDEMDGFLLLAIVGLGPRLELRAPEKPVKEYEEEGRSVKINGKKAPDSEDEYFRWKYDVTVPCGDLKETKVKGVKDYMEYNEYVVYNSKQVKPVFLVKTKFEVVVDNLELAADAMVDDTLAEIQ